MSLNDFASVTRCKTYFFTKIPTQTSFNSACNCSALSMASWALSFDADGEGVIGLPAGTLDDNDRPPCDGNAGEKDTGVARRGVIWVKEVGFPSLQMIEAACFNLGIARRIIIVLLGLCSEPCRVLHPKRLASFWLGGGCRVQVGAWWRVA